MDSVNNQIVSQNMSEASTTSQRIPKKRVQKTKNVDQHAVTTKKIPNDIIYNISQLKKYTYNNVMENNDDDMVKGSDINEGEVLKHDTKFHSIGIIRLLEYIRKQCATDYGKKLNFKLENMFMILRMNKIFFKEDEYRTVQSVYFDVIDIINTDNTNPNFKGLDLFSKKRSLFRMNRPFSQLRNILSVFIYNKYCIRRFVKLNAFDSAHAFVLLSNFHYQRKTISNPDGIEEINHYTWHSGTIDNMEETAFLKSLCDEWDKRHDLLFYKMETEYPFFQCMSIDDYFLKSQTRIAQDEIKKNNTEKSKVTITLDDVPDNMPDNVQDDIPNDASLPNDMM